MFAMSQVFSFQDSGIEPCNDILSAWAFMIIEAKAVYMVLLV